MLSRNWLGLFALVPAAALAWGDDCKVRAERNAGIDVAGVEKVVLRTGAGDLKVRGSATAKRIEAKGEACAAKQELLDASQVNVRREGKVVYVETALPQDKSGWSWGNNDYAYIDLGVSLPSGLPVEAIDSSGDAELSDLKSLEMQDSSGDLDIEGIAGLVEVNDSSGDLEVERVGSARVRDSSGDIEISEVSKDVTVLVDSSGDMRISRVQGSVEVQQDSSGGIRIEDVKGSVKIDSDSSGDIYAGGIGGDFTVSEDSSGSIGHGTIAGKITVPSNHADDVE
jgi:DUF4097 and DUF4098 domain-containing protein YvlB